MEFSPEVLALLVGVAFLAGYVDSIAGGGGLLVIPALLAAGVPPVAALATNKLQASGGSLAASLYFVRKGRISPRRIGPAMAFAFVGALAGGWLLLQVDANLLRRGVPILLVGVAVFLLVSPSLGVERQPQRQSLAAFAATAALGLGFYDGFFGPGTGMLLALAGVGLLGLNLVDATAHAKVLNFASNSAALLLFSFLGEVLWLLGGLMLVGQVLGGYLGAKTALKGGQTLIRWTVIAMCIAMCTKLLFDALSIS